MPSHGGKWVTVLNTGTANRTAIPSPKIRFRSNGVEWLMLPGPCTGATTARPRSSQLTANNGAARLTSEGRNSLVTIAVVVTCPPIHSMVVVTSPMGDQAPPALAAITTSPAR